MKVSVKVRRPQWGDEDFTRFKAGRLRNWAMVVLVVVALSALAQVFYLADAIQHFEGGWKIAEVLARGVPAFLYLFAIWTAVRQLGRVAKGRLFSTENGRGLIVMGAALTAGALFTLFVVPAVQAIGEGGAVFSAVGRTLDNREEALLLAVFGGALQIAGRLLVQAAAMRNELDEFF